MGTMVELNDTLQLTTDQGFPAEVFDYAKHQRSPIVLDDVKGRLFSFHGKPSARIYQLDPVRVYLVHNIENKWLFWGRALIQSLEIEKQLQKDGTWDGKSWITNGTYLIEQVYDPDYQRAFTLVEAPADRNYFK